MRFYSTQYKLQDPNDPSKHVAYNSSIYASTYGYACKIAVMRRIGELVIGAIETSDCNPCPLPSQLYKERKMMDCLHTLTFYGWIGTCSGVLRPESLISDVGLIHEVMHEIHHPRFYGFRKEILKRLADLEKTIPGLKTYVFPENFEKLTESVR